MVPRLWGGQVRPTAYLAGVLALNGFLLKFIGIAFGNRVLKLWYLTPTLHYLSQVDAFRCAPTKLPYLP